MFGLSTKPKTIAEHEAEGELGRIYHEIRQVLRVNGVNLVFRRLATYRSFPALWEAWRPVAQSVGLFEAADRLRAESVRAAEGLGRLEAREPSKLGESQGYQVRAALALYHDVNPKLLVLVAAAKLTLEGEKIGQSEGGSAAMVERGVPATMYPMEMVDEETRDPMIRALFEDIQGVFDLPAVNSDYRTLALWPGYLGEVWERLKPVAQKEEHAQKTERLRETARQEARGLPVRLELTRERITEAGDDPEDLLETLKTFERVIALLVLNISWISLDWHDAETLRRPPYPAPRRAGGGA